jgi:hypothetical protein
VQEVDPAAEELPAGHGLQKLEVPLTGLCRAMLSHLLTPKQGSPKSTWDAITVQLLLPMQAALTRLAVEAASHAPSEYAPQVAWFMVGVPKEANKTPVKIVGEESVAMAPSEATVQVATVEPEPDEEVR